MSKMDFSLQNNFFNSSIDDIEVSKPTYLEEEDLDTSDDATQTKLIHDKNKVCPMCSHVYTTEEDFVAHSALHFSRPSSSTSTSSASLPNSPNSVEIGNGGPAVTAHGSHTSSGSHFNFPPKAQHGNLRPPPPPYGSHLQNFWTNYPQEPFYGTPATSPSPSGHPHRGFEVSLGCVNINVPY